MEAAAAWKKKYLIDEKIYIRLRTAVKAVKGISRSCLTIEEKCLEREICKKKKQLFVERSKSRLKFGTRKRFRLNVFLVVKLLRAHEGCLGTIRRRRTR